MLRILFLIVLSSLILSACGQKGPLYLPEATQMSAVDQISDIS